MDRNDVTSQLHHLSFQPHSQPGEENGFTTTVVHETDDGRIVGLDKNNLFGQ